MHTGGKEWSIWPHCEMLASSRPEIVVDCDRAVAGGRNVQTGVLNFLPRIPWLAMIDAIAIEMCLTDKWRLL